jgi:hypothetical protein
MMGHYHAKHGEYAKLSTLLLKRIKHLEHGPWLPRRNDIRLPTGVFNTATHKNKIHMSGGTWQDMFLPINALAYAGDGGMGAREIQKSTSSGRKLPSRVNVTPHSLPVPIKCWGELQRTFPTGQQNQQHTTRWNDYKLRPIFNLSSYN